MTEQTLIQRIKSKEKILRGESDISEVNVGDVVVFETSRDLKRVYREELVVEKTPRGLETLYPEKSEDERNLYIKRGRRSCILGRIHIPHVRDIETYSSSQNFAKQRTYEAVRRLLTETGVIE